MSITRNLSLVVFSVILLSSCGPKEKMVEVKNQDGITIERYSVIQDTIRQGSFESYYDNGDLFEASFYKAGALEGTRTIYFQNGKPEVVENYSKGIISGPFKTYYADGQVNVSGVFVNGVLEGIVQKYYETGEIKEEVSFQNNLENGPFTEYYQTGGPKWKGTYIGGNHETGPLDSLGTNGDLEKKMI